MKKIASYMNNTHSNLISNGGTAEGDLYGVTEEERGKSTAYKTVYKVATFSRGSSNRNLDKSM